jgi:hypothetical protein
MALSTKPSEVARNPSQHVRFGALKWESLLLLSAWYAGQQLNLLSSPGRKAPSGTVSKEDLLERLRKSALSEPEMLHAFHRLSATDRDRMLSELQRDELVRQDENDKWVGCAKGTGPE